jgi:uncharacterized protein (TIRG00374 family)
MKKIVISTLKIVLPLGIGVYLLWFLFSSMDETVKKAFYASLNRINYFWVILSLILSTLTLFSRAYRWKYMLEPMGYKSSFWNRYHAVMIGYIMNLTIPRAGEASRSLMLFRAEGIPFAKSFGTIVAERVFDIIMLAAVLFLTVSLAHSDFWEMKTTIENQFKSDGAKNTVSIVKYILIGVFALGFLGTLFIQKLRVKVLGFLKNVWEGLTSIFKTKHPFYFIGHTLFIWVNYIVYFAMVFLALPETASMPFSGILVAFVAGSIGISLTNGGIGVFPLLVGLVIEFYIGDTVGAEAKGIGYAIGLTIWGSQTLLIILLGLISLWLLPKKHTANE